MPDFSNQLSGVADFLNQFNAKAEAQREATKQQAQKTKALRGAFKAYDPEGGDKYESMGLEDLEGMLQGMNMSQQRDATVARLKDLELAGKERDARLGQLKTESDMAKRLMDFNTAMQDEVDPVSGRILNPQNVEGVGARAGVLGTPEYDRTVRSLMALNGKAATPFAPSGGVQTIQMPNGETIAIPFVQESPNSVKALPEFSEGNKKYAREVKQPKLDPLLNIRIQTLRSELSSLDKGLTQNQMASVEEKNLWKTRRAEVAQQLEALLQPQAEAAPAPAAAAKPAKEVATAEPMPRAKTDLVKGKRYQTPRGVATWDGAQFIIE